MGPTLARTGTSYRGVKRLFDLAGALALLIILSPVILVTAVVVAIGLGRPILFRQKRAGYRGQIFEMIKFRSMTDARDADGNLMPDDQRLPRLGQFLRASSLDELPELWNILRGDMSLIGPRPLLVRYLDRYTPEQARRHEVRPGLTGWAQVNGRNTVDWDDRLAMDVWYVDHQNFRLDVIVALRTVITVLRRSGVSAEGHATMPEFMGSERSQ
jgi:lipopolysaccharide/colanic/teichoic acid biosynthesis glycosyltransferase